VTLNVAASPLVFVTLRKYEPAPNPVGSRATVLRLVNDTKVSAVVANNTFGARPEGLKLAPVIVTWLFDKFTTAL
jgi:hypothetical protein